MKILNYGSLNIDYVYTVDHLVKPGETISSKSYIQHCGGKGLNQSIALANAGMQVYHAGKVGKNSQSLLNCLKASDVDVSHVVIDKNGITGHAIIQVDKTGQNSIIIHGGNNQAISRKDIDNTLSNFSKGDYLLLQNEINNVEYIIYKANKLGMMIIFNHAPLSENVKKYPLELVDILIVNEVEGSFLTGVTSPEQIIKKITNRLPNCIVALTLGKEGSMLYKDGVIYRKAAHQNLDVVDTTAAGDTFIGYLVYCLSSDMTVEESLELATKASAYCISKKGTASSIPKLNDLR